MPEKIGLFANNVSYKVNSLKSYVVRYIFSAQIWFGELN